MKKMLQGEPEAWFCREAERWWTFEEDDYGAVDGGMEDCIYAVPADSEVARKLGLGGDR